MRGLGWTTVLLAAGCSGATAQVPAALPPVAVELFTSQGCSSCPPADVVMGKLAAEPGVVAITRPVTYWDRLGWKDTLAQPANTQLQQAYTGHKIPGAGNYTPQSVVAGTSGAVGGQEAKIRQMIGAARRQPQPSLVVSGGAVTLSGKVMAAGKATAAVDVVLVAMRRSVTVPIGSGENGGRKITYTNVLLSERNLGKWTGGAARFTIPAGATAVPKADRYAVLVRQAGGGPILAARYLS